MNCSVGHPGTPPADDGPISGPAGDHAHTTFVRLRRSRGEQTSTELVLSRAAMHLHTFGVLSSIEAGDPGFVSDRYLNAISAETSITALELCLAGLWERTACGYRVTDSDTLSVAAADPPAAARPRCAVPGQRRSPGRSAATVHCTKCGSALSDQEYRPRHAETASGSADAT